MFAIEQHLSAFRFGGAYALADRKQVLLLRCLQSDLDVVVPGLGNKADGVGVRIEQ